VFRVGPLQNRTNLMARFSSALDQTLHDQQVAEDRADAARDQLEYEDFCQSITEFAARFSWAVVLKAVSAAFTAHDQFLERR
jgi:hypothetical protein